MEQPDFYIRFLKREGRNSIPVAALSSKLKQPSLRPS